MAKRALPAKVDRGPLETLYRATKGPNWLESRNWLTDAPLAEWYGVSTNDVGRVRSLGLAGNDLAGPIPREIGNLAALQHLRLAGNRLTGPIPQEIGSLAALKRLYLDGNQLSGWIPSEIGKLDALEVLDLSGNDLTGPIPPETGNLAALVVLGLADNRLLGPIPPEIGNLAALKRLHLSGNEFLFGWITPKRNLNSRVVLSPRVRIPARWARALRASRGLRDAHLAELDTYLAELKDAYRTEWKKAHPAQWNEWKDAPTELQEVFLEFFLELNGTCLSELDNLLAELTEAYFAEESEELHEAHPAELRGSLTAERDYDAEDLADDLAKDMDRSWQKLTGEKDEWSEMS